MAGKGKITITEKILLLSAVLFLALVLGIHLWELRSETDTWSVRTQKAGSAESFELQTVDINTADVQQLQRLEGIGPVLAQRIVDWREANGKFTSAEDLLEVDGIGNAVLENMREFIIIGDQK